MISGAQASAIALLFCLACQSTDPGRSQTPATAPEKKAPTPLHTKKDSTEAKPQLPMPPGERVSFEKELKRVSEFRHLEIKGAIVGVRVKVSDLIAHVEASLDLGTPESALSGTEEMLVALGIVPLSFEYRATMMRLLRGELAGLYEPRLKTMLIRADLEGVEREMTLLHELVHALQDQHFDLDEVVEWNPDDSDRSAALSCLAEGDATSAMFDGVLPDGQSVLSLPTGFLQGKIVEAAAAQSNDNNVPPLIARSLRAPYLDGITFVHALRRRGGWSEVDRVWRDPPVSTEQVLHLDKYDSREKAIDVAVPAPPPGKDEWKILLHDIWGEQSLRLVFEEWLDPPLAEKSAAGWGGDRIVLYENSDLSAFSWHLVADSEKDADEMFQAFQKGFMKQSPPLKGAGSTTLCEAAGDGPSSPRVALGLRGRNVLLASAPFSRKNKKMGKCEEAVAWLDAQLKQLSSSQAEADEDGALVP